jgi:hypothetical protein
LGVTTPIAGDRLLSRGAIHHRHLVVGVAHPGAASLAHTISRLPALEHVEQFRDIQRIEGQFQGTVEVGVERVEDPDHPFAITRTHARIASRPTDTRRKLATG